MCLSFLGKFYQSLEENDVKFNSDDIEKALVKTCKDAKGKENRFVSKPQIESLVVPLHDFDPGCVESDSRHLLDLLDFSGQNCEGQ